MSFTMQQVWGFSDVLTLNIDVHDFCKALNEAALSRSITPNVPSDALDLSRDLMITEAAHSLRAWWRLDGHTLYLWTQMLPESTTFDENGITTNVGNGD